MKMNFTNISLAFVMAAYGLLFPELIVADDAPDSQKPISASTSNVSGQDKISCDASARFYSIRQDFGVTEIAYNPDRALDVTCKYGRAWTFEAASRIAPDGNNNASAFGDKRLTLFQATAGYSFNSGNVTGGYLHNYQIAGANQTVWGATYPNGHASIFTESESFGSVGVVGLAGVTATDTFKLANGYSIQGSATAGKEMERAQGAKGPSIFGDVSLIKGNISIGMQASKRAGENSQSAEERMGVHAGWTRETQGTTMQVLGEINAFHNRFGFDRGQTTSGSLAFVREQKLGHPWLAGYSSAAFSGNSQQGTRTSAEGGLKVSLGKHVDIAGAGGIQIPLTGPATPNRKIGKGFFIGMTLRK